MPSTDTFALVDRIFDGGLAEQLKAWRGDGLSIAEITYRLRTEHSITVATTTVWRWLQRLDAEVA